MGCGSRWTHRTPESYLNDNITKRANNVLIYSLNHEKLLISYDDFVI
jgi:hypothetical protein